MLNVTNLCGFGTNISQSSNVAWASSYATWNPADTQGGTLSNGNLTYAYTSLTTSNVRANIGKTGGKWYWEVYLNTSNASSYWHLGTWRLSTPISTYMFGTEGESRASSGGAGQGHTYGMALDCDSNTLYVYDNNSLSYTKTLTAGQTWYPVSGDDNSGAASTHTANFGATAFTYTPPSGYTAGLKSDGFIGSSSADLGGVPASISGVQAGDLLIAILSFGSGSTTGWTLIKSLSNNYSGGVYYRIATGSDTYPNDGASGGTLVAAYRLTGNITNITYGTSSTEPSGLVFTVPAHTKQLCLIVGNTRSEGAGPTYVSNGYKQAQANHTYFVSTIGVINSTISNSTVTYTANTGYLTDLYSDHFMIGIE